jgi:HSP20 family protein
MAKEKAKDIQRSESGKELEAGRPVHALTPFEEMETLFDRWLESSFPRRWPRPFRMGWPAWGELAETHIPKVDVIDRDEDVLVRAEVPGVDKDNLDVSVSDDTVTIKGETRREEKVEKENYYRCETSQGSFARTVALPSYVDSEGARAKFKDGVLELTLPKVEKAKRRTIKID